MRREPAPRNGLSGAPALKAPATRAEHVCVAIEAAPSPAVFNTELIDEQRARSRRMMPRPHRLLAWSLGAPVLALGTALAVAEGSRPPILLAAGFVVLYAVVSRVGFEVMTG